MFSALFASAYGELLANITRDPSTYFIYPAIIPLIPGDLFFLTLLGFNQNNSIRLGNCHCDGAEALYYNMKVSTTNCLLTLLGMSVGFVLSSTIAHYIRKTLFRRRKSTVHAAKAK